MSLVVSQDRAFFKDSAYRLTQIPVIIAHQNHRVDFFRVRLANGVSPLLFYHIEGCFCC
jgi:hypothetical protein